MNDHILEPTYWNDDNDYLIIEAKTGIFYTDQIGGMSCDHFKLEGFYYPLWFMIDDKIACDKGCYHMHYKGNEDNVKLIANEINKELIKETKNSIISLSFDFDRIKEMEESFYPVLIKFEFKDYYFDKPLKIYNYKGFLITGNCD